MDSSRGRGRRRAANDMRLTRSYGIHGDAFTCAREFVSEMEGGSCAPQCASVFVELPGFDELTAVERFRQMAPQTPLIFLRGASDTRSYGFEVDSAVDALFEKPIDVRRLMVTLLAMPDVAPVHTLRASLDRTAYPSRHARLLARCSGALLPTRRLQGRRRGTEGLSANFREVTS
jgi:FixJ family two-component response regulator